MLNKQVTSSYLLILFVVFLIGFKEVKAQFSDANFSNFSGIPIAPSANAASLGKYGEIPVSYYTGTPKIEIPIHELKLGSYTLPVSISYHASGIKVAQEASSVGLGWALNAGGVITRSIRSLDDFQQSNGTGYYWDSDLPPANEELDPIDIASNLNSYQELYMGIRDAEPDVFYYNFGGFSGKMFYSPLDNKFVSEKVNNLKIEYSDNTKNGRWNIYTADGVKYVFSTPELTADFSYSGDFSYGTSVNLYDVQKILDKVTSWYLDSIVTPNNDFIVFNYQNQKPRIASMITNSHQAYRLLSHTVIRQESNHSYEMPGWYHFHYASQTITEEVYLSSIETSRGERIEFINSGRDDRLAIDPEKPAQKLSKVIVKHNMSSLPPDEYDFFYSYHHPGNYKTSRLMLDSLKRSSGNMQDRPYIFSYYPTYSYFPSKDSKAVDHWGYFNNHSNSSATEWWPYNTGTSIPSFPLSVSNVNYNGLTVSGANRKSNIFASKQLTLNKIQYPTGGGTVFDFESNDHPIQKNTVIDHYSYTASTNMVPGANDYKDRETVVFTLTENTNVTITAKAYSDTAPTNCHNDILKYNYYLWGHEHFPIFGTLRFENSISYWNQFQINNWDIYCWQLPWEDQAITVERALPAGTYEILAQGYDDFITSVNVSFSKERQVDAYYVNEESGGIRIKGIYSSDGNQTTSKRFHYDKVENGVPKSSGILMSVPNYFTIDVVRHNVASSPGAGIFFFDSFNLEYLKGRSNTNTPMGFSAGGAAIGYDQVTVFDDFNAERGKTVFNYHNEPEIIHNFSGVPNTVCLKNGSLIRKDDYSKNGELRQSHIYNHTLNANMSGRIRGMIKDRPGYEDYENILAIDEHIKFYETAYELWELESEKVQSFTAGDQQTYLEATTYYKYHPQNFLPSEIMTTKSGEKTQKIKTYFLNDTPTDNLTSATTIQQMNEKNMIGITLKEEVEVGDILTKGKITNYGSNLLPESVYIKEENGYQPRFRYQFYDERGNLAQSSLENGAPASVIWAYNKSLPVLVSKNTELSVLNNHLNQALQVVGYGNTNFDNFLTALGDVKTEVQKNLLKSFINALNNLLPEAVINFYTYEPLAGKATETNEKGETFYFEYDNLKRLISVRNFDGHILKNYVYNKAKKNGFTINIAQEPEFYVRVEISNYTEYTLPQWGNYMSRYGDVHLRFYRDKACTIPVSIKFQQHFDLKLLYKSLYPEETEPSVEEVPMSASVPQGQYHIFLGHLYIDATEEFSDGFILNSNCEFVIVPDYNFEVVPTLYE